MVFKRHHEVCLEGDMTSLPKSNILQHLLASINFPLWKEIRPFITLFFWISKANHEQLCQSVVWPYLISHCAQQITDWVPSVCAKPPQVWNTVNQTSEMTVCTCAWRLFFVLEFQLYGLLFLQFQGDGTLTEILRIKYTGLPSTDRSLLIKAIKLL